MAQLCTLALEYGELWCEHVIARLHPRDIAAIGATCRQLRECAHPAGAHWCRSIRYRRALMSMRYSIDTHSVYAQKISNDIWRHTVSQSHVYESTRVHTVYCEDGYDIDEDDNLVVTLCCDTYTLHGCDSTYIDHYADGHVKIVREQSVWADAQVVWRMRILTLVYLLTGCNAVYRRIFRYLKGRDLVALSVNCRGLYSAIRK